MLNYPHHSRNQRSAIYCGIIICNNNLLSGKWNYMTDFVWNKLIFLWSIIFSVWSQADIIMLRSCNWKSVYACVIGLCISLYEFQYCWYDSSIFCWPYTTHFRYIAFIYNTIIHTERRQLSGKTSARLCILEWQPISRPQGRAVGCTSWDLSRQCCFLTR